MWINPYIHSIRHFVKSTLALNNLVIIQLSKPQIYCGVVDAAEMNSTIKSITSIEIYRLQLVCYLNIFENSGLCCINEGRILAVSPHQAPSPMVVNKVNSRESLYIARNLIINKVVGTEVAAWTYEERHNKIDVNDFGCTIWLQKKWICLLPANSRYTHR